MVEQVLKSKFLGAFLGTAIGDALGAPFEGYPEVDAEEIEKVADSQEVLTYTDDTHMMIGIAESLLKNQGFDGEDMALTFTRNYELEPWRGYGPGPPHIFQLVRAGVAWDEAALRLYHGGSYGNGSAMRVAPVGVFYHDDPARLRDIAYQSSQITHAHQLGKEGAALQAYAVALATNLEPSSPFDRGAFLAKLINFVSEGIYREKLNKMEALLRQSDKTRVVLELGNGIEAFNSVPAAIYSFLSQPHSFARAVFLAISLGGDTDTIGAMTGAISGAYLGFDAIPYKWRDKLENHLYIAQLAERLCKI
ncbi:MAG TPA: ADP-ribosylglycohydrolase family protein [Dehalococcoidales bacterium]|nr:ADP-ribosylglycohydrolase family protein [Dehalococcoidales bacterium]